MIFFNKELYKKDKIYAIEEEHKGEYFEWISHDSTTLPIYPKNWDKKISIYYKLILIYLIQKINKKSL